MLQNEEDWVARAQRGDREAFGHLYDRYAGLVRSVCFEATGNMVDAQDLAQEVFLNAFRQIGQLSTPGRFVAWLLGIARLSGLEWRRTRCRDRHQWTGAAIEIASDDGLNNGDPWTEIHDALCELSEDERLGIHLFYLEEQPAEQARKLLNLSQSGFYRLIDRARKKLARRLKAKELN